MDKILEIKNLNLSFKLENGFARAIHDISFGIEKGKALGIVGESGCGKSVTAMAIMRLLAKNGVIESGEIFYEGENILNLPEKQMRQIRGKEIALIPQDPHTSLNPLYTIGEQILETVKLHQKVSSSQAKEMAIEALKAVKIPEAEKRFNDYPHEFSGGMCQRVIIAMALSCNPKLIIADEPTTALDVTVQAQIMGLIEEIQKEKGTSLLLITHDLGVVAESCHDVIVMYAGRIVEFANVESIFNNPMHPYTKALLESLPTGEKGKLKSIEGQPPSITEKISGCPFHPRCPYKMDVCTTVFPPKTQKTDSHFVHCYLYE